MWFRKETGEKNQNEKKNSVGKKTEKDLEHNEKWKQEETIKVKSRPENF